MSNISDFPKSDEDYEIENAVFTIENSFKQYGMATDISGKLHNSNTMWNEIQKLKADYPNNDFAQKNFNIVKKLFDDLDDTRKIASFIDEGNKQYKKRDLGDKYFESAIEHYKLAIAIMINPAIWFAGDVPIQPVKRYLAYLKKNDKIDELDSLKLSLQEITDKKEQETLPDVKLEISAPSEPETVATPPKKEATLSLDINPSIVDKLPITVKSALSKMSTEEQMMFQEQYQKKSKSVGLMVFLAIVFPIQMFLLGKTGLGVVFILSLGGLYIWWIIEWFVTPKRVREYNGDVATKIVTEMKIMQS